MAYVTQKMDLNFILINEVKCLKAESSVINLSKHCIPVSIILTPLLCGLTCFALFASAPPVLVLISVYNFCSHFGSWNPNCLGRG